MAAKSRSNVSVKSQSSRRIQNRASRSPSQALSITVSCADNDEDNVSDGVSGTGSRFSVASTSVRKMLSVTKSMHDEASLASVEEVNESMVDMPPDFRVLPMYKEVVDDTLPIMEVFPVFRPEEGTIDEIVNKMDKRIRKNMNYKTFLEETKKLLTYVLQEIKLRKTIQDQLNQREEEMRAMVDKYKNDPRVYKVIMMADHWRSEKDQSEEKIQLLLVEINTLTMDLKIMENKLAAMQKRQEKMEVQIQKGKACDQEKERLEEQLLVREKALIDMTDTVEHLKSAVTQAQHEAAHREIDYRSKLETAPDRNAVKLAALTRELEVMSLEKEYKAQEARELHDYVNALVADNNRTSDRVKVLMTSVRGLRSQMRTLESRHQVVLSQNKDLRRKLDVSVATVKLTELDSMLLKKENLVLQKTIQTLKTRLKTEEARFTASLRKISVLELNNRDMQEKLTSMNYTVRDLEQNTTVAKQMAKNSEKQAITATKMQQNEAQRVKELQRKLVSSGKHIRVALHNLRSMTDQIDRTGDRLKFLDSDLIRCQAENVRNQSTIMHLFKLLDSSENMVRLQTRENDALVINKNKMVATLKACFNSQKKLTNEVSRLASVKTSLEDAAFTHRFMLDFVENERDSAARNTKSCEDTIVIMQRKQVAKLAQIARCNADTSKLKLLLEEVHRQVNVQKKEIYNLNHALKIAETACANMESTCKKLMQQRDMFGSRILQQNNEAELSRIKMDTMSGALDRVSTGYRDRCNDILVLKKEIQNLRRRVKALEHTESLCQELRLEVAHLSKNMCLEMNKRAAIERLKVPKMHHHRELQCSNPSMYELILKIQKLQRLLIRKTQESIAKEKELAIKNDTIKQLEMAVYRRNHDRVLESTVKSVVQEKDQKIKALMAEVNMLTFYQDVNQRVAEEQRQKLGAAKHELIMLRRAKSAASATSQTPSKKHVMSSSPSAVRFKLGEVNTDQKDKFDVSQGASSSLVSQSQSRRE